MDQDSLFQEYKNVFLSEEDLVVKKEKKERVYEYNPFALQDALGARDIKKIWIEYIKLRTSGVEAEELIHKIISKVRDMAAISLGATKEDLNIKSDYPYSKSKRDLKNWEFEDLKNIYTRLVEVYHQSRMGGEELDMAVEKTLLSI